MSKLCKNAPTPSINIPGQVESTVEGLFPTRLGKEKINWPVTEIEIIRAENTLKSNKTSGPDGVSNEILNKIVEMRL